MFLFWSGLGIGLVIIGWTAWNLSLDAWWQPTDRTTLERIICMADLREGDILYDLGCGDGRIVVAAAQKEGVEAVGVEIDPVRVLVSKLRALLAGVYSDVDIKLADIYGVSVRDADVVVIFLSRKANEKLAPKFKRELKSDALIVSYYHILPDWTPVGVGKSRDGHKIYAYRQGGPD